VYLRQVNLSDADLHDVDVSEAIFDNTEIRGADLRTAKGLTQDQLDRALGDASTLISYELKPPGTWPRKVP
jgi:uncharacterized protein YjbI with pentapeptide repeats